MTRIAQLDEEIEQSCTFKRREPLQAEQGGAALLEMLHPVLGTAGHLQEFPGSCVLEQGTGLRCVDSGRREQFVKRALPKKECLDWNFSRSFT